MSNIVFTKFNRHVSANELRYGCSTLQTMAEIAEQNEDWNLAASYWLDAAKEADSDQLAKRLTERSRDCSKRAYAYSEALEAF